MMPDFKAPLISYAKNFEDVTLWRALRNVGNGTYIDIGVQDPVIDSVSLAFYERGWRGLHVTPDSRHAEMLQAARPDEIVTSIEGAVSLANLFDLCKKEEIHWLRIRSGNCHLGDWKKDDPHPWIILFENLIDDQENTLLEMEYDLVYFDGLTRFYLSRKHPELAPAFGFPPNLFDNFVLSGKASSPFCGLLNSRIEELELQVQSLQASRMEYAAIIGKLSNRLIERNKKWASRLAGRGVPGETQPFFPEAAHLSPRARSIYSRLRLSMKGR